MVVYYNIRARIKISINDGIQLVELSFDLGRDLILALFTNSGCIISYRRG